jgi:hypothetical protein
MTSLFVESTLMLLDLDRPLAEPSRSMISV